LDNWRYKEWLNLLTEDVEYTFYTRQNINADSPEDQIGSPLIMDDRFLLEKRVNRLYSEYAWAEIPRSMTRHFVTNVRVANRAEGQMRTLSNVLFYRHRHDNPYHEFLSYERRDLLRREGGELRIARREIIPDTNVILVDYLSTLY